MERSHPLGEDFARWIELTDAYKDRLAHASAKEMPDRRDLAGIARRLRELSRLAQRWSRSAAPSH